jgi:hypothetical protein
MDIEDICIYEAAHAVVYEALDIRLKQVWIEENSQGVSWGAAERGKSPDDLAPALLVLEFMAGAAALFRLTELPLDRVIKKTTSDFCIALKYLGQSTTTDPRRLLQWLGIASRGFVSEWTAMHSKVIINLALALQKRRVPHGRCELDGMYLHLALAANWKEKPSTAAVIAFAEAGWSEVQRTSEPLIEATWHDQVLESCGAMNDIEGNHPADSDDSTGPDRDYSIPQESGEVDL